MDDLTNSLATIFFGAALIHGLFGAYFFRRISVELVMGAWAIGLVLALLFLRGWNFTSEFVRSLHFVECVFVFVILSISGSRPILEGVRKLLLVFARVLPLRRDQSYLFSILVFAPLAGSLITEPAAMTVAATLLLQQGFSKNYSASMMYLILGVLLVNVSIGGAMTHFAAPAVLMVASHWGWDTPTMFTLFGWRALLACLLNGMLVLICVRKSQIQESRETVDSEPPVSIAVSLLHWALLVVCIYFSHQFLALLSVFLVFVLLNRVTRSSSGPFAFQEAAHVAVFLAGLVILGARQSWWIQPLVEKLSPMQLFWGATGLTAVTDNAALTYLGSRIPDLSGIHRYMLVAGALVGGGLTLMANAPNPIANQILGSSFGERKVLALRLFMFALPPTIIAAACFAFYSPS